MKVIAYIKDCSDYMINLENFKHIDHINYCFATIRDTDGNVDFPSRIDDVKKIKELYPNVKISLSIGGWGAGNFSEMAEKESSRKNFVKQIIDFIVENNFVGIDMDWEYPGTGGGGISYHFNDKYNYSILSHLIKDELNKLEEKTKVKYYFSLAIGSYIGSLNSFEIDMLNELYDYLNIMNYDFIGMDRVTCHHSNLNFSSRTPHKKSIVEFMQYFIDEGLDKSKIIFGIPFYGRGADKVEQNENKDGLGNRIYGEVPKFYDYTDIHNENIATNFKYEFWDEEACAPYFYDGDKFVSYENEKSIKIKLEYMKKMGFSGLMFWEYALDNTSLLMDMIINNKDNAWIF
ncbi:MAG: glycoside hydrolase family 18 protein [Mycoplasmatales bacterium]